MPRRDPGRDQSRRAQADFKGVIDLINRWRCSGPAEDKGNTIEIVEIPAEQWRRSAIRAIMLEKVAELDDTLMEKYLTARSPAPIELRGIRKGTIASRSPAVLRLGVQVRRRAAAAGRGHRLPAEPARPAASRATAV